MPRRGTRSTHERKQYEDTLGSCLAGGAGERLYLYP